MWEDAIQRATLSIWIRAYSFDDKRIVKAAMDAHEDGLDVRILIDATQAKNRGTSRTIELLKAKKVPYVLVEGPLVYFDQTVMGYELASDAPDYKGVSYPSNHHYKQLITDVVEVTKGGGLHYGTHTGYATGSCDPSEFSRVGTHDDAVFVKTKVSVEVAAKSFLARWWAEDPHDRLEVRYGEAFGIDAPKKKADPVTPRAKRLPQSQREQQSPLKNPPQGEEPQEEEAVASPTVEKEKKESASQQSPQFGVDRTDELSKTKSPPASPSRVVVAGEVDRSKQDLLDRIKILEKRAEEERRQLPATEVPRPSRGIRVTTDLSFPFTTRRPDPSNQEWTDTE